MNSGYAFLHSFRQQFPVLESKHHPEMGDGNGMPVDWVGDCGHFTLFPDLRIEVGDKLVTEHVEINPCLVAPALGETHLAAIEITCLFNVAHLDGQMERGQLHIISSANR